MKKGTAAVALFLVSILLSHPSEAGESKYFFRFAAGTSLPFIKNLSDELALQGQNSVSPGYSVGVSLGRAFMNNSWSLEGHISISRYPIFHYENNFPEDNDAFQEFEGRLLHYGYFVILKKCFRPGKDKLVPYAGIGAGYGKLDLSSGGGKIDAPEIQVLLQLEHRVGSHVCILAECIWTPLISEEQYSSPFLVENDYDYIAGSNGQPLDDGFSSVDFRLGVKVWLKPPKNF